MEENKNNKLSLDNLPQLPKAIEMVPAIQKRILDGDVEPLKVAMFFKKIEKISKELYSGVDGDAVKEAVANQIHNFTEKGKTAHAFGNKVIEQNRSYYDFSVCGDVVWDDLDKIEKQVKELKKQREEELKLKIPKAGFGIKGDTKIEVSYYPKLVLEEVTELALIRPPSKGSKTQYAFHV